MAITDFFREHVKQAIATAQREQVIVYAVSARDDRGDAWLTLGDRGLKALAQQTAEPPSSRAPLVI
jgi:hypothetical protein